MGDDRCSRQVETKQAIREGRDRSSTECGVGEELEIAVDERM